MIHASPFWLGRLEGWKWLSPRVPDEYRHIRNPMVQEFIQWLPWLSASSFETSLFKAAYTLVFFGAFHSSELISGSCQDSSDRSIILTGISIKKSELHIHLWRFKMDQHAYGVHILLHSTPRSIPCPVQFTAEYFTVRPQVCLCMWMGPVYLVSSL